MPLGDSIVPSVWVLDATGPALVLGSSQRPELVAPGAAERLGYEVTKRRSGGGAVLVVPDDVLWVDVLLPAGDRLWDDDVGRAFLWLGEVWVQTLAALGVKSTMHTGGLARTDASDLVCFAGRGPGEVFVEDHKVVGISQRRTRAGARFQCAAVLHWDPSPLEELLDLDPALRATVATAGASLGLPRDDLLWTFLSALASV